jgi:hypothetical protein
VTATPRRWASIHIFALKSSDPVISMRCQPFASTMDIMARTLTASAVPIVRLIRLPSSVIRCPP